MPKIPESCSAQLESALQDAEASLWDTVALKLTHLLVAIAGQSEPHNTVTVLNLGLEVSPEIDPHRTTSTELVGRVAETASQTRGLSMEE